MAVPDSSFQTYTSIGNREDLIDVITNISPVDTFVTSHTADVRAEATYHEWQKDALAAAAENAVVEGDDASATAVVPTEREGNYTQILRKTFQITDTQEAINKAGRKSEMSYQTQKNLKELAKDIEYALVINATAVSGASGTARKMKGMLGWVATNSTTGTGTGTEALTEDMLNDNLQLIWAQGGKPATILCGAFQKRAISGFSTNTRDISAESKKLVSAVDIYQSDFGTIMVHLHHQMNTTAADKLLVLGDMSLWQKAWLRPVKKETLARTGASSKVMIEAELTLESRQEKGSGKVIELTVA